MKIYFSTSATNILKNIAKNIDTLGHIMNLVEKNGHTLTKRTMLRGHDTSSEEQEKKASKFFEYIDGATEDIYKSNTKKIKNCDLAIFESTYPAEGIGYEIGYAISQNKPVLILVDKTYKTFLAEIIEGIPSNIKQLSFYEKKEDIDEIFKSFVAKAKTVIDTKFILIISPEIDRYFEWAKKNKRLHKAQVVRDAMYRMMDEDKAWKDIRDN
jgi:nucleoside 2-deoxyribosyltransferase